MQLLSFSVSKVFATVNFRFLKKKKVNVGFDENMGCLSSIRSVCEPASISNGRLSNSGSNLRHYRHYEALVQLPIT